MSRTGQPISRNLELEALRQAVEWPTTSPQVVLPLFAALAGVFQALAGQDLGHALGLLDGAVDRAPGLTNYFRGLILAQLPASLGKAEVDRKSTRLNSSHVAISYAVFCLKK